MRKSLIEKLTNNGMHTRGDTSIKGCVKMAISDELEAIRALYDAKITSLESEIQHLRNTLAGQGIPV
jgi:hypothetical protein